MLSDKEAIAMIAVKDLKAAARFYQDTLGLTPMSTEGEEVITYRSGSAAINVYHWFKDPDGNILSVVSG